MRSAVAAAALCAIAAAAVACTPGVDNDTTSESISPPPFALTSADVVFADGRGYPINLVFVAKEDDPIWTQLKGVTLSADVSFGPGQFDVIRGEGTDGYFLGNVTFELPIPPNGISFDSVAPDYKDLSKLLTVPVGVWDLHSAPASEFATEEAKAEVAAMADCTGADLPVPAAVASIESLTSGSSQVSVDRAELAPDMNTITMSIDCSGDFDFYVISPFLDFLNRDDVSQSTRFAPISIGFQDIDNADLETIRER